METEFRGREKVEVKQQPASMAEFSIIIKTTDEEYITTHEHMLIYIYPHNVLTFRKLPIFKLIKLCSLEIFNNSKQNDSIMFYFLSSTSQFGYQWHIQNLKLIHHPLAS